MARRIPLPRLTRRQRMARWQRERRQRAIYVTAFTSVLVFVLGLAGWAASDRYYQRDLTPAAEVQGRVVPKREFQAQLRYELVRFYVDYSVPPAFENDPQLRGQKDRYADSALEHVVEHRVLDIAARDVGVQVSPQQVDEQYQIEFGEFRVRHILISVPKDAEDKDAADATAQAKARAIANELREAPNDQEVWDRLAEARSDDPGTKFSGGELGSASRGQYVPEFENAVRTLALGQISDPIRTQFGYHIIQLEERHDPAATDVVKRYLSSGYTLADLKAQARYEVLRKEFQRRAEQTGLASPTEQIHLAKILVHVPLPSASDFQSFTDALSKQSKVRQAIEAGTDFAEIAKQYSEDTGSKDKGGDVGWVAKGMIVDPRAEQLVFSAEAGKTTDPINLGSDWIVYRILERSPSRELADDQKQQVRQNAYQYWLQRQKKAYDVRKLITGLSIE